MIMNGLILPNCIVNAPNGPYLTTGQYTFSAECHAPNLTFAWTAGTGVTIVSGGSTGSVTVSFGSTGVKSLTVLVTNNKGVTINGAWIGAVV
jgi:hypothetical protein